MKKSPLQTPSREGQLVEFKMFYGGISVKETARTLCAFANTSGGNLYIGVTDSGETLGLEITPDILDQIQNAAREGCSPAVQIELSSLSITAKKSVLIISTPRSNNLHSTADGQTYIRVGTQDKRVLGDELLRLAETKSQASYEDKILDCGIEVLDIQAIEEYAEARLRRSLSKSKLSPEELLIKIGLASKENNKLRIKAGAFILFGKADDQTLLQRDLVFVVYGESKGMYSYREDISLPVSKVIMRVMELLRPINVYGESIHGVKREQDLNYPEGAIREVLLNAIAHRDYRIQGLRNEVRVFPDRIEFISAGGLPGMITLENIETQHYSRNPKIVQALLTLGYVEELGQGIDLMKRLLKESGNPGPVFESSSDTFKVTFIKATKGVSEEEKKSRVLNALQTAQYLSRSQLESKTGLASTTLKNVLSALVTQGRIIRTGKGKATRYSAHS